MRFAWLCCALMVFGCGPSTTADRDSGNGIDATPGPDAVEFVCSPGSKRCTGQVLEQCADNAYAPIETCPEACDPVYGCVLCTTGTGTCDGDISHACNADGTGYEDVYCDPAQGMTCDESSGRCVGACAPDLLQSSYIGCDYFPTVTAQATPDQFNFTVAVANTSSSVATVTIDGGGLTPRTFEVAGDSVHLEPLPWVPDLKSCNGIDCRSAFNAAAVTVDGAYHLRSTHPVTVYQFSPLEYTIDGAYSFSNDASLLLPTNVLTGEYVVAAWEFLMPFSGSLPGILAVTAIADGTEVTVTSKVAVAGVAGTPNFGAGAPTTVTLNQGDVLQLLNGHGDLTGSVVAASKPVQVIGGHFCTFVPIDVHSCDHLEDVMFPIETLSTQYIVSTPGILPDGDPKERVVRIVAALPGTTTLSYDPPVENAPTSLQGVGDFVEISREVADFVVTADQRVLVAQYMEGMDAGGETGDPSMSLAVTTDQYRSEYLFHAPLNYEANYVNITAPMGTTVMLDGEAVAEFTAIGNSGYGVARIRLGDGIANDGNHSVSSSARFGVSVYGYGQATSYWYPGGLNLEAIPIE